MRLLISHFDNQKEGEGGVDLVNQLRKKTRQNQISSFHQKARKREREKKK